MSDSKPGSKFWLGNGVLALAMLMLLNMGQLWEAMGVGAMVLWGLLVAAGVYLLMQDKSEPPNFPG